MTIIAIKNITVFEGLNVYSPKPAVRMVLKCGDLDPELLRSAQDSLFLLLANAVTKAGAAEFIVSSPGKAPSGVAELARRIALKLQRLLGHDIDDMADGQDRNYCVFGFRYATIGILAGRIAVRLINAALDGGNAKIGPAILRKQQRQIDNFFKLASPIDASQRQNIIIAEITRRDIPWSRIIPTQPIIQLGQGRKIQRLRNTYTKNTSYLATMIATNKAWASWLFQSHGIPAPDNIVVQSEQQAVAAAEKLGFPVVVKPNTTDLGTAVSTNLSGEEAVRRGYELACQHGVVLVEKHIPGDDFRFTVLHGKTAQVAQLRPAHVVGNGRHTIAELVEIENQDRSDGLSERMKKISLGDGSTQVLKRQNYTLEDIPAEGTEIFLRTQSNLSQGGTVEFVTSMAHPENLAMAERAARLIGLDVAGVDFITTDITQPFHATGGAICEVNPTPGILSGPGDAVEKVLLDAYFPPGDDGRIPIAAIAGSFATAMTARALSSILSRAGYVTGIATTQDALIGGIRVGAGDFSGVKGCKTILHDPNVGAAILETSFEHIIEQGFGFDRCSVSAVIASPDTADGGMAAGDIVKSKELAVAAASDLAVIDAADPHFEAMMAGTAGTPVCVASLDPKHANAIGHIEQGGIAILLETRKGIHLLDHWQAGNLAGSYTPDMIPALRPGTRTEMLVSACFACGLALGLGVKPVG
ncbi:MAG: acetate--CoA ligase family protein [Alphaproteobacteria bacterium]|nr:acetate--CoA ligase family protein [Alphaproteobacteria bacterium]